MFHFVFGYLKGMCIFIYFVQFFWNTKKVPFNAGKKYVTTLFCFYFEEKCESISHYGMAAQKKFETLLLNDFLIILDEIYDALS